RTLLADNEAARREIAAADAILVPTCPVTEARIAIARVYAPSLAGRAPVALTPCFDMYVRGDGAVSSAPQVRPAAEAPAR
ncbi:MAG: hypothetical protein ACRCTI_13050, partial [Beijerinckiaceae bacterium]